MYRSFKYASLSAHAFIVTAVFLALSVSAMTAGAAEVGVVISDPKDGSTIFLSRGESMPARRPIRGHITGVTPEELKDEPLLVAVSIRTDKWYQQGVSRVQPDGSWHIRTAHFGGADHLIRAELRDKNGNVIASSESTVLIVQ